MLEGLWLFNGLCLDIYREYWGEPSATRILINISTTINGLIQYMCRFLGEHLRFKLKNKVYTIKFSGLFVLLWNHNSFPPGLKLFMIGP